MLGNNKLSEHKFLPDSRNNLFAHPHPPTPRSDSAGQIKSKAQSPVHAQKLRNCVAPLSSCPGGIKCASFEQYFCSEFPAGLWFTPLSSFFLLLLLSDSSIRGLSYFRFTLQHLETFLLVSKQSDRRSQRVPSFTQNLIYSLSNSFLNSFLLQASLLFPW